MATDVKWFLTNSFSKKEASASFFCLIVEKNPTMIVCIPAMQFVYVGSEEILMLPLNAAENVTIYGFLT